MLTDNPGLKSYKEAGFKFVYIVNSTKEPTKILYQDSFSFTKQKNWHLSFKINAYKMILTKKDLSN